MEKEELKNFADDERKAIEEEDEDLEIRKDVYKILEETSERIKNMLEYHNCDSVYFSWEAQIKFSDGCDEQITIAKKHIGIRPGDSTDIKLE